MEERATGRHSLSHVTRQLGEPESSTETGERYPFPLNGVENPEMEEMNKLHDCTREAANTAGRGDWRVKLQRVHSELLSCLQILQPGPPLQLSSAITRGGRLFGNAAIFRLPLLRQVTPDTYSC